MDEVAGEAVERLLGQRLRPQHVGAMRLRSMCEKRGMVSAVLTFFAFFAYYALVPIECRPGPERLQDSRQGREVLRQRREALHLLVLLDPISGAVSDASNLALPVAA